MVAAFCCFAVPRAIMAVGNEEVDLAVLKKAFGDGMYNLTESRIERFLERYPYTSHMDELRMLLGECFFYQRRFSRAIYELGAVAEEPNSALQDDAVYWMGEVYYATRDYKQALACYERIIEGFPSSKFITFAQYSKGWVYYMLGSLDAAKEAFRDLVRRFPNDALAIESRLKTGEALYLTGKYNDAVNEFKKYLDEFPVSDRVGAALFLCGEAYFRMGDFREAALHLRRAMELGQNAKWMDLASYDTARALYRMGDYNSSLERFSRIQQGSADDHLRTSAMLGEAESLVELGLFDKAIAKYDEALLFKGSRDADRVYYGKAEALFKKPDLKGAEYLIDEALEKFKESNLKERFHLVLGDIYIRLGKKAEGMAEFEHVVKTGDIDLKANGLCAIGEAYASGGDYRRAIESFDSVLKDQLTKPQLASYAQYRIGEALLSMGRAEEAAMAFQSCLVNFPESGVKEEAHYMLAAAYLGKEDFQSAAVEFDRFISLYPSSNLKVSALLCLANSLYNMECFGDAAKVYGLVIESGPKEEISALARYAQAWCWYNTGDEGRALGLFESIVKRYPNSSAGRDGLYWLGEYSYNKGRMNIAERHLVDFLKRFPDSDLAGLAHRKMGSILKGKGKYYEAIDNFKKAYVPDSDELNGQIQYEIGECLEHAGRYAQALEEYLKVPLAYPKAAFWSIRGRLAAAKILETMGRLSEALRLYEELSELNVEESKFAKERIEFIKNRETSNQ